MTDRSCDDFLGGKVRLWQPTRGYRAGVDPVLLAAAVDAKAGQTVLDLGCGVGAALFCLAGRVPGLDLTGVEVQAGYADLARENARLNGVRAEILTADLRNLPSDLRQRAFHHVLMNPPYYDRGQGTGSDDAGRDIALGGDAAMTDWIGIGAKRVRPKGTFTLIQSMQRLPETLAAMISHAPHLGSLVVLPIVGRAGRAPSLFVLQAQHGGRAPFHLSLVFALQDGAAHNPETPNYSGEAREILRNGGALAVRR